MQANRIQFGKEYAVNYKGALHSLRVTEMINVRTGDNNATNYVQGTLTTAARDETGRLPGLKVPVADVLEEIEKYRELVEEKARQKRESEAVIAAKVAKKELAARLLAKAIGVHVILETKAGNFHDMVQQAHVRATGYSGLDVDEKAFDALIEYLQAQGVKLEEEAA